jgi:hypothetical protein
LYMGSSLLFRLNWMHLVHFRYAAVAGHSALQLGHRNPAPRPGDAPDPLP